MKLLYGQRALITGAGSGIGKVMAQHFEKAGARIWICDADNNNLEQSLKENPPWNGNPCDVSYENQVDQLFKEMKDSFGGLEILVNNAGIFPRVEFLEMTEADWDGVQNVNLKAGFFCAQAAARRMIAAGQGGAIINIASVAAYSGPPLGVHYAASKGGVIGMTRALAMALARQDIRVNAIAPGLTDTAQPRDGNSEAEIAVTAAKLPLGRIIQPQEIADAAVFLGSDESLQMTGQVMHINGGQMFR